MELNIGKEVAAMQRMTVRELRAKYAEVFGEPTNARHKQWLVRRVAWRMQAVAEGDLSQRARQRAAELANDADLRTTPPKAPKGAPNATGGTSAATLRTSHDARLPMPGQELTRQYKGQTLIVRVLADGFEFEGEVYKSLSAVAKAITGTHCNGYHFFRLNGKGRAK
jgi:hypothetical protein